MGGRTRIGGVLMCKHILINEFTPNDIPNLKAFASMTHDRDGFGAIIRTKKGVLETLKSLDLASFYFDLSTRILKNDIQTLVVHHRTSTNGDGIDYAHPFEFMGNLLTHNGVVNVPGSHDTKTRNDSEALLHHLIKTGYATESIQGYFSCFILSDAETTVLVDDIAPIYSDGRIYSSHRLGDNFERLTLERLTLDPVSGLVVNREKIKVTKTDYGSNLAHLSIGSCAESYNDLPVHSYSDNVEAFFDSLTYREEDELFDTRDYALLTTKIGEIGAMLGLELTEKEIDQLCEIFRQ